MSEFMKVFFDVFVIMTIMVFYAYACMNFIHIVRMWNRTGKSRELSKNIIAFFGLVIMITLPVTVFVFVIKGW